MTDIKACFDTPDFASCLAGLAGIPIWLAALLGIALIAVVLRVVLGKRSAADDKIGPFDMT